MIYAMACADDKYMPSAQFQLDTAIKKGKVDKTICFNIADMDTDFRMKNKKILESGEGRRKGCYLWKPYFVYKALESIDEGDFLIYMDSAGGYYRSSVESLIDIMKTNHIDMVGSRRYKYYEKHWTKRDTFVYMNCDNEKYLNQYQCWAGMFVLRKTDNTKRIVNEWLEYAQDYRLITDMPNTCGLNNYDGFVTHRHDQSILSLLQTKYNVAMIEKLPVADFYVYHHTMETSIRNVKKRLRKNRMVQIKQFIHQGNMKGIYYIERERYRSLPWIQKRKRKEVYKNVL